MNFSPVFSESFRPGFIVIDFSICLQFKNYAATPTDSRGGNSLRICRIVVQTFKRAGTERVRPPFRSVISFIVRSWIFCTCLSKMLARYVWKLSGTYRFSKIGSIFRSWKFFRGIQTYACGSDRNPNFWFKEKTTWHVFRYEVQNFASFLIPHDIDHITKKEFFRTIARSGQVP